jgi:penicillin amidase
VDGKNVTEYVAGSTVAGLPLVMIGRTKTVTWGITAGVTDTSDLYEEQLDESGEKYMVDGQWRDLSVINYEIKVKDWEQPEKYDLKLTHRGPVISSKLLSNAVVLFGSKVPIDESKGNYSMAWAGHEAGDSMIDLLETMMEEKTVPKIKE